MIRLIALDVDGTLVGTRSRVSDATAETLRAAVAAGVYVTLATARSFQSARRFAEPFGLNAPLIVRTAEWLKRKRGLEIYGLESRLRAQAGS